MTFANCQMGGMHLATPDVCLTPAGTSIVPIPYPNIAQGAMADPSTAAQKIMISGTPAHTLQTIVPTSSGDEPGVVGGVMSGMIKGPQRHLMGANNILIGGMPATKMTDQTGQNGSSFNAQGTTTAPAQTKVMLNSGGGSSGSGGTTVQTRGAGPQKRNDEALEFSLKNLRWEHKDNSNNKSKDKSKTAEIGAPIVLKVDVHVTKGKLNKKQTVRFDIFDESDKNNPKRHIGIASGPINNGVAQADWAVFDPSGNYGKSPPKISFEARLLNKHTNDASITVQYVKPTIILHDSVGEDAAPLINTQWKLFLGKEMIASGKTDKNGRVSLPFDLNPFGIYDLRFSGKEIRIIPKYSRWIQKPDDITGAITRLVMLGYNCGDEGSLREYSKAAMLGYRDDKGLGFKSGSPFDDEVAQAIENDISENE